MPTHLGSLPSFQAKCANESAQCPVRLAGAAMLDGRFGDVGCVKTLRTVQGVDTKQGDARNGENSQHHESQLLPG